MISGKLSPISIGLTNEADIHQMIKSIGYAFKLCEVLTKNIFPPIVFINSLMALTLYDNFWRYFGDILRS